MTPNNNTRFKSSSDNQKHKKHHRPYRLRHFGLLFFALILCLSSVFQLGVIVGKSSQDILVNIGDQNQSDEYQIVNSAVGFSLEYERKLLFVQASEVNDAGMRNISDEDQLSSSLNLVKISITPDRGNVSARNLGSRLVIGHGPKADKRPQSDGDFSVAVIAKSEEEIGGKLFEKTSYQQTPKIGSLKAKIHLVQWRGKLDKQDFTITLRGLVNGPETPSIYNHVFRSLNFDKNHVLGHSSQNGFIARSLIDTDKFTDEKYRIDFVSPAVVKLYHVVCGGLAVNKKAITDEGCLAFTGTGFFVSSDGYIATNGHVVVFEAEDAFIMYLSNNPSAFKEFLKNYGLSDAQIANLKNRPDVLSSIIAEIYDLPKDTVTFLNERHTYIASIGDKPVQIQSEKDLSKADNIQESTQIKKAKFIGADYLAKDLYVIQSDNSETGFMASDVALLKVDMENTPLIMLSDEQVSQGQRINILGFPSDAENQLIDRTSLSTTVTSGSVSSIRAAAGGRYTLYQSDADASQGNSGGPVLDTSNHAIGLLTYRFKSGEVANAAKSYIRDIGDLKSLISTHNITLDTKSTTQTKWEEGIIHFSNNRFSKALANFEFVKNSYPAHRLIDSYMDVAKEAIANGQDVNEKSTILMIAGIFGGVGGITVAIMLIARHRVHHHIYKIKHGLTAGA